MATTLTDGAGYIWDFTNDGSVTNGTADAFDGGLTLTVTDGAITNYFSGNGSPTLEDSGREQVFTSAAAILGLSITRKAYVPATGDGFVRYTEFVTNTTASTITRTITITSNLGSDSGTVVRSTSSGDTTMAVADNWIITDDGTTDSSGDPSVLHYFATPGGLRPSSVSVTGDLVSYSYALTLAPGQTKGIIHFAAQNQTYAGLTALAATMNGQGAPLFVGLSATEQGQLVNVDRTLESSVSVNLPLNYANLVLTGTANINGLGNALDNQITGNSGNNTLYGMDGNDTLIGLGGGDTIDGGNGTDTVIMSEKTQAISVTLNTSTNARVYVNGVIEDTIRNVENVTAGSGNDSLAGDGLANRLLGGDGNDTLRGGGGNDVLSGGNGTDTATYSDAVSTVTVDLTKTGLQNTGATGSDVLSSIENLVGATAASNKFTGSDGANVLTGGTVNDSLYGGLGNDTIYGGGGNDLIYGETPYTVGNLVRLDSGSFTNLATSITFDTVGTVNPSYSQSVTGIGTVNVTTGGWFVGQLGGQLPGQSGVTTLVDNTPTAASPLTLDATADQTYITTDSASPTSPILSGTPEFNGPISVRFSTPVSGVALTGGYFNAVGSTYIEAYDTNGTVLGRVTNTLIGIEFFGLAMSTGEKRIAGISFYISANEPAGFGIDNLTFGSNTTITEFNNTNDSLKGDAGNDTIYGGVGDDRVDGGSGDDLMDAGLGEDTAVYASATAAVSVSLAVTTAQATGGAGTDTLKQFEHLEGSAFADVLTGNAGINVITGGLGRDTMDGGTGVDTINYLEKTAGVVVTFNGATAATVTVGGSAEDSIRNFENLIGGSGADRVTGDSLANIINGNGGNDTIAGGDGLDKLFGGAGSDQIDGGLGNDSLDGGTESDTLNGGLGVDTMRGGTGNDYFVFNTAPNASTNYDLITDWAAGDKIRLENSVFTAFAAIGVNASPAAGAVYSAAGATAAHDADDRLIYNPTTGNLYYDADGLGGAAAIRFANFSVKPASLAATDFLII